MYSARKSPKTIYGMLAFAEGNRVSFLTLNTAVID